MVNVKTQKKMLLSIFTYNGIMSIIFTGEFLPVEDR